jgi:anti-sigma factor RsiW
MKCRKARKLVALYVTGDLDYHKAEAVKEHVITCDACAEEAETYRQSLQTLGLLRGRSMPVEYWDGYWEELRGRIHTEKSHPRTANRAVRAFTVAAAAAVVLLAVIAAWPWLAGPCEQEGGGQEVVVDSMSRTAVENTSEVDFYLPRVVEDSTDRIYDSHRWDATCETARAADF